MTHSDQQIPTANFNENRPPSEQVQVAKLAGLFSSTTNSYKYLFFLAIIRLLKRPEYTGSRIIVLEDIITAMLSIAWYPAVYFKLSFGYNDQITRLIQYLPQPRLSIRPGNEVHITQLEQHYRQFAADPKVRILLRYVPYRLLRPFFAARLRGIPDAKVNGHIAKLAFDEFASQAPLYYVDQQEENIIFHTCWFNYFLANQAIVEKWVLWQWLDYMQKRNPNVPNIMTKLLPPKKRGSLKKERTYWEKFLLSTGKILHCP
jgi:hypothetical protein